MTTMATLQDLRTPSLIVDLDVVEANLERGARYAAAHGLALRPHVKTHKSPLLGAMQLAHGATGLTCATTYEATVMSAVTDDVLIAYPPVGRVRAEAIAALPSTVRPIVALDSEDAIRDIAQAAANARRTIGVYVELDVGMLRVGVPDVTDALALAASVDRARWLEFAGITVYPGHIREAVDEQTAALQALETALADAIERFRAAGLPPRVVSGGSTPTIWRTHEVPSITEMRPGTYIFNDRTTAGIGACAWEDCAATVLATVISTSVPGQAVIDAGTKSLGREPMRGVAGEGFGALRARPDVMVTRMSEEHGILDLRDSDWQPAVGEQVRVVPNHICIAVHLHDEAIGLRGGAPVERWPISARGREPALRVPMR